MARYLIGNIKGPAGENGVSPAASVEQTQSGATITITDATGTTTASISNGVDGAAGPTYTAGTGIDITNNVISATGSGGITTETDPVFSASPAATITSSDIAEWDAKSDFSGSYNDLTNKPDLSVYATNTALGTGLSRKQDTLTAGTNITIENNVISAAGSSGSGSSVMKTPTWDNSAFIEAWKTEYLNGNIVPNIYVESESMMVSFARVYDYNAQTKSYLYVTFPYTNGYMVYGEIRYNSTNDTITTSWQRNAKLQGASVSLPSYQTPGSKTNVQEAFAYVKDNYALKSELPSGGATYTAGDNITIDANNVISVDGLNLEAASEVVPGATNITDVTAGGLRFSAEAGGSELGYIQMDVDSAGLKAESNYYQQNFEITREGMSFGDTANNRTVTLAPNANYDGFTVNGNPIGGGSSFTPVSNELVSWNGNAASSVLGLSYGPNTITYLDEERTDTSINNNIIKGTYGSPYITTHLDDTLYALISVDNNLGQAMNYYFSIGGTNLLSETFTATGSSVTLQIEEGIDDGSYVFTISGITMENNPENVITTIELAYNGPEQYLGSLDEAVVPHTYLNAVGFGLSPDDSETTGVPYTYIADDNVTTSYGYELDGNDEIYEPNYSALGADELLFHNNDGNGTENDVRLYADGDVLKVDINGTIYTVNLTAE